MIYMLVGCLPGERCVIERTEQGFVMREDETNAANDWTPGRPMWEARVSASHFLTRSAAEATLRCRARRDALAGWRGLLSSGGFNWVKPPVLNPYTRLAITMSPARGILSVAAYEIMGGDFRGDLQRFADSMRPTRLSSGQGVGPLQPISKTVLELQACPSSLIGQDEPEHARYVNTRVMLREQSKN
jgi:hypothetical protein